MSLKQGYAFGTRIRISEEIIKTLKMYQLSHYHLFLVKFLLLTVLWLAILPSGNDEIFNFLLTSMKKECNIRKLQIITEFAQ